MKRKKLEIAAVYDTETTNIGEGEATRAFPILFIDNDIRGVDLRRYDPEIDGKIHFYRHEDDMLARIDEYILWGKMLDVVPVICAYNLMFDLQPLMERLNAKYKIKANAQSSTNVYTVDLFTGDNFSLRFWDTYHLEMRGLSAMGETCGLSKATGDWDYNLRRTGETKLTDMEMFYAARDVEVIPAYLQYLLRANEWMDQSDLGFRVITKTSIVRQMARHEIARLKIDKSSGKKLEVGWAFTRLATKEMAPDYDIYALRKACFRGGFTFTAARYAMTIQRNVVSADVTSMHHTFINGRFVPQDFKRVSNDELDAIFKDVIDTPLQTVLSRYGKPFYKAFHAQILFTNIRLRKGTCFEEWGIALESTSKFKKKIAADAEEGLDPRNVAQENAVKSVGWYDQFEDAEFAFGKLYAAKRVILHVNEIELWALSRVYEWDTMQALIGEATGRFKRPPDYVTLQSNKLFEQKSAAKFILFHYTEGVPYEYDTKFMPDGIKMMLKDGTLNKTFFEQWYSSTIKGMFNGIYGTQAQDIFRPAYKCVGGNLTIDDDTITTEKNYESKKPKNCKVLYTYGMRIVGGSRMHMVIAMELLYKSLGSRCHVLGGDTDSMKIACDYDVTDDEIDNALEPLAKASKVAIDWCMERVRAHYPDMASTLDGVGGFEIENRNHHYQLHYEMWNKARISFDGIHARITCAGLPRPIGQYTIETFMDELMRAGYPPARVISECVGFNTFVAHEISHTLEHHRPNAEDVFDDDVTDYLGETSHVVAHESVALYRASRWLGETLKITNRLSVEYLEQKYGREIDTDMRYLQRDEITGKALLLKDTGNGPQEVMRG